MRKWSLITGLLLILLIGASMVSAEDDLTPKPGTPADNECYPGGVLYREENQDGCPTLWYWKAGWYLARYNRGLISRDDFPKEFESVLPPLQKPVYPCWNDGSVSILYIGPANYKGNMIGYPDSLDCTGTPYVIPGGKEFVVFANNFSDAIMLCAAQGTIGFLDRLNTIGYANAPANAYGCAVF